MGEDPRRIQQDIEQTRERMGDTVEALGYKADVPGRAKKRVSGAVDTVKEKVSGAKASVTGAGSRVSDATPDAEQVKQGAGKAVGIAEENPIGLALGAMGVGFLAGLLIPSSGAEQRRLGPMADQVKERAKETGQEAVERGKQVAEDVAGSAKETVQESGREQAEGLRSSAQEKAQEVRHRS